MKPYVITNAEGVIVGSGVVQSGNTGQVTVPKGCAIHFGIAATIGSTKKMLVAGKVVNTQEPIVATTYQTQRRSAYPPVEAQMDMLWHAMNNGDTPKIEPFYSDILAVKQRYPKPSN